MIRTAKNTRIFLKRYFVIFSVLFFLIGVVFLRVLPVDGFIIYMLLSMSLTLKMMAGILHHKDVVRVRKLYQRMFTKRKITKGERSFLTSLSCCGLRPDPVWTNDIRPPAYTRVNPTTGLPCVGGGYVDAFGTPYGFAPLSRKSFDGKL